MIQFNDPGYSKDESFDAMVLVPGTRYQYWYWYWYQYTGTGIDTGTSTRHGTIEY